jgi:beta-galactosidase
MRLAEVEVYSDVISVRLTGPETLAAGGRGLYTASLRLPSGLQVPKDARFDLEAPDDWQVKRHRTTDTQAGWLVTAPSAGWSEPATLRAVVTWREGGAVRATDDEHAVVWAAPPPPPEPGQHWVSDLPFLAEVNGWGPVERDMSNGDKAAGDGGPIAIDGVVYEKGLGVHADSSVTFALDRCDGFTAVAGLDDLNGASVGFLVEADGVPVWVHPLARAGDPGAVVEVDLTGVTELRLAVNALGHNGHDHANWGAARLHGCAS